MKPVQILLCFLLGLTYVYCNMCSYKYCHKEELGLCNSTRSREECNAINGLYLTYREYSFTFSKHTCCNFTLADLPKKHLYCVRNIRSKDLKCSSDYNDTYRIKIVTNKACNKFGCE